MTSPGAATAVDTVEDRGPVRGPAMPAVMLDPARAMQRMFEKLDFEDMATLSWLLREARAAGAARSSTEGAS